MVKIKDIPLADRPIERLIKLGPEVLSNEEIVAILLKTGTKDKSAKDLANILISQAGSLEKLGFWPLEQFSKIKGIGLKKAAVLIAALEFGKRCLNSNHDILGKQITNCEQVFKYYQATFYHKTQECFTCLYLDVQKRVLKSKILFVGSLNFSMVHPREVFKEAYLLGASSIICLHNHPSGHVLPSTSDFALTKQLVSAGNLLGVPILDHVIVGKEHYYSFLENNQL